MIKLNKNIDMTQGIVWKQLIMYSIPLLLGELFQQLYNTVDVIILGNFVNVNAMAAVAATDSVTKLLVGFFNGISVGSTVIVAFYFGKKDRKKINQSISTIISFSFYVGLALSVIGLLIARPILNLLCVPRDLMPLSIAYIRIYFMGLLGLVLYNTVTGVFRALGDARRPFYFLLLSSFLNIVLDLLFVVKFNWSVAGVAYATIISQALSALLCLMILFKDTENLNFSLKLNTIKKPIIRRVLKIGLPIGFQKTLISLSNVIVLSYINFFGASCLAGWVVYTKLYQFITTGVQSISSTITVFVSQNEGAKKTERANKGVATALFIATIFILCLSLIIFAFNGKVAHLFGDDENMHKYATLFIKHLILFQILHAPLSIFSGALRGKGKSANATLLAILGLVIARQLYLTVITKLYNTPLIVGASFPIGWSVSGLLLFLYYNKIIKIKETD